MVEPVGVVEGDLWVGRGGLDLGEGIGDGVNLAVRIFDNEVAECSVAAPDVCDGLALMRSEYGEADLGEIVAGL